MTSKQAIIRTIIDSGIGNSVDLESLDRRFFSVLICLVRAGMVLNNTKIWKDFIISRNYDVGKNGGSNKNIRPNQHRTLTSGRSNGKGKLQIGKLGKTRFVKTAEVE